MAESESSLLPEALTPEELEILPPGRKKVSPLKKVIYLILFLTVALFVGRELFNQLRRISWDHFSLRPLQMALAFGSFFLARAMLVFPFRAMVRVFCPPPSWPVMMAVAWLPQLGKYLPGKVFSVAGIVWLLRRFGVPVASGLTVALLLSGLSISLGFMLSLPLLFWGPVAKVLPLAWLWCIVLIAGGLACLHPKVWGTAANFVMAKLHRPPLTLPPNMRSYAMPLVNYLLQWVLMGLSLYFMAQAVELKDHSAASIDASVIPLFVAATALSTCIGVLAVFAPAGLGIREGVLLLILGPLTGHMEIVSVAVLATRIIQTVVELMLGGVGFSILHARTIREQQIEP